MAKRAGITVSEKGDEAGLGWWPDRFENVTGGWIGTAKSARGNALLVAQRLHLQNRAVIEARTVGKKATTPEPDVRAKIARADLKKLDEAEHQLNEIERGMFEKRISMQPFDYSADGFIGAFKRGELRAALNSMPEDKRQASLKKSVYRAAALEQPPELSGITESKHSLMMEEERSVRFPQDVANLADAAEAVQASRETINAAKLAANNELSAVGTKREVPAPAPKPETWE